MAWFTTSKQWHIYDSQPFRSPANSLPGANRPIEPWPIRSLELSLPGLFAPWPSRSLELSLPGPFAPWPSRYSINRIIFAALAYSLYRPMTLWRGANKTSGAKGPRSESSRERNGQGTKGPGSDLARERIGQSPIGWFAPGSELARERKGSVPTFITSLGACCSPGKTS